MTNSKQTEVSRYASKAEKASAARVLLLADDLESIPDASPDEIRRAQALIERREQDAREDALAGERAKHREKARTLAARYAECAASVDSALAQLESSVAALRAASSVLGVEEGLSGLGSRHTNREVKLRLLLKWATWLSAPKFAREVGLPHQSGAKRASLATSLKSLTPNIKDPLE